MNTLSGDLLRRLANYDSPTISNAIEKFNVRTRNEGYVNGAVRCLTPGKAPAVGYAVTACVRTSNTPVAGRYYYDRSDWWDYVQSMPAPRFVVIQDVDHIPGFGALWGEVHARIAAALSCVAFATNGSVRDIAGLRDSGVQAFANSVCVSHAYAHIVHFGERAEIGGLEITHGDLLHGDENGIVAIPLDIAHELPSMADRILEWEKHLLDFCASPNFSPDELQHYIQRAAQMSGQPDRDPAL